LHRPGVRKRNSARQVNIVLCILYSVLSPVRTILFQNQLCYAFRVTKDTEFLFTPYHPLVFDADRINAFNAATAEVAWQRTHQLGHANTHIKSSALAFTNDRLASIEKSSFVPALPY
jgi:hypothetical protein